MNAPQNNIWGPSLWIILHSSAEKIGLLQLRNLPHEESRIWGGLLGSLRYSLPCPQCKKHFSDYFAATPLITINQNTVRIWLYNLHYQANNKANKTNEITVEQLSELYSKPFNFTYHFNILYKEMLKAQQLGWCRREDIQRTVRFLQELKRLYSFF